MGKSEAQYERRYNQYLCNKGYYDKSEVMLKKAEVPIIKAVDFRPTAMIPFNEAIASVNKGEKLNGTVHMFISDRHLERLWTFPEDNAEKLKDFEAICSPDFSLYLNWDAPMNFYNLYRNRVIGHYFQEQGLTVIPTVTWSDPSTYDYAFLGLEPEGTYALSANGCFAHDKLMRDLSLRIYQKGMQEFVNRLNPRRIIVHGSKEVPNANYGNAEVVFYQSKISVEKNYRQHYKNKQQNQQAMQVSIRG